MYVAVVWPGSWRLGRDGLCSQSDANGCHIWNEESNLVLCLLAPKGRFDSVTEPQVSATCCRRENSAAIAEEFSQIVVKTLEVKSVLEDWFPVHAGLCTARIQLR